MKYRSFMSHLCVLTFIMGLAEMWHNDIALVKLEEDLPTNGTHDNIAPVRLPPDGLDRGTWPQDGQRCVMKGWGCTAASKQSS